MTNETEIDISPKTVVQFTRSSTKDAGEGFSVRVTEGANTAEAARVMALALQLRQQALAALKGPSLEDQLEASIKAEIDRALLDSVPLP